MCICHPVCLDQASTRECESEFLFCLNLSVKELEGSFSSFHQLAHAPNLILQGDFVEMD